MAADAALARKLQAESNRATAAARSAPAMSQEELDRMMALSLQQQENSGSSQGTTRQRQQQEATGGSDKCTVS